MNEIFPNLPLFISFVVLGILKNWLNLYQCFLNSTCVGYYTGARACIVKYRFNFLVNSVYSTYAKFPAKVAFLTPLIRRRTRAYKGVRSHSFSKNFCGRT